MVVWLLGGLGLLLLVQLPLGMLIGRALRRADAEDEAHQQRAAAAARIPAPSPAPDAEVQLPSTPAV